MATRNLYLSITYLCFTFSTVPAHAFDLLKLHCSRQEQTGEQIFLSEINFRKAGTVITHELGPTQYEGEVVSYSIHANTKQYVSGYNLFSISYLDDVISGLTGDPVTRSDGSFTLTKVGTKTNGIWKFAYNNIDGLLIDANFQCMYLDFDLR